MPEIREAPIDRYYSPQIPINKSREEISIYQPTPKPESVIINNKARVHKNNSHCISCLLACFLCFAVKGESSKPVE
ncbi:hypothetical protein G6F57_004131 [Rhizopus arrhizus]|uniref:Cysteine-rich transmembrane CYSTM domain-containing protein n=1 Tax=Rhizopus oryzae TaxID=64495 RepID=A0A9P6XDL4_RHIOR|nr:hypothetical protein G6F23_002598 [Rhizopus arrhizus]KAG1051877.1 hypothetical protein G6F43_005940 [Rhizopus delemar]KAG0766175.1 hypothetical protein G6F24_003819 [Rhizopus arrhizus]KAG0792967.1 hypothetical protein G6F21_003967 [Rhizopus arrhizus]KAG0799272.1 hypothetical protein G6F22_003395 [Rhizopus arrhizus]